jgi:ATP-dependent DNA helicase RecQ
MRPAQSFNDKMSILVPFLKSRQSGGAIVYVTTQQNAVDVADGLNQKGVKSKIYHAGMPAADRKAVQESFMSGKDEVICATIAFGMGIDKSDIRQIAHFMLPKTLEGYSCVLVSFIQ